MFAFHFHSISNRDICDIYCVCDVWIKWVGIDALYFKRSNSTLKFCIKMNFLLFIFKYSAPNLTTLKWFEDASSTLCQNWKKIDFISQIDNFKHNFSMKLVRIKSTKKSKSIKMEIATNRSIFVVMNVTRYVVAFRHFLQSASMQLSHSLKKRKKRQFVFKSKLSSLLLHSLCCCRHKHKGKKY